MIQEDQEHKIQLLKELRRQLHVLELQQARMGLYTPPHILNQIEDIKKAVQQLSADVSNSLPTTGSEEPFRETNQEFFNCEYEKRVFHSIISFENPYKMLLITSESKNGKTELLKEFGKLCRREKIPTGYISFKEMLSHNRSPLGFSIQMYNDFDDSDIFKSFSQNTSQKSFLEDIKGYSSSKPLVFIVDNFEYIGRDLPSHDPTLPTWFIRKFIEETILSFDKRENPVVSIIAGTRSPRYDEGHEVYRSRVISLSLKPWNEATVKNVLKSKIEKAKTDTKFAKKWTWIFKELVDNQLITTHELIELIQKLLGSTQ